MPWDIVLPVLGAVAVAVAGYLGWIATVDGVPPERKKIYKVLFVVCTCIGIVLNALTAYVAPKPVSPEQIQKAVEAGIAAHPQNNPQNAVQTKSGNPTLAAITQAVRIALPAALPESHITKTTPPPPSTTPQISVPEADQTKALKTITSAWTQVINDWADSRLKDVPESSLPMTEAESKKVQDFHARIDKEWLDRFATMSNVLLMEYRQLGLITHPIHACSGNINLGYGERGQLETYKKCAGFIQAGADQLK